MILVMFLSMGLRELPMLVLHGPDYPNLVHTENKDMREQKRMIDGYTQWQKIDAIPSI